jgi:hypothetical protein
LDINNKNNEEQEVRSPGTKRKKGEKWNRQLQKINKDQSYPPDKK